MQTPHPGLDNGLQGTRSQGVTLWVRAARLKSRLLREQLDTGDTGLSPAAQEPAGSVLPQDRFQVTGLRPIDRRAALSAAPSRTEREASSLRGIARPIGWLDWVLLGVEVVGALVVGWLVLQYIYTVYFDTAPRRVSPPPRSQVRASGGAQAGATATRVATRVATATPTLFVEVLPPLSGPGGTPTWQVADGGATGAGPQASTATPTPVPPTSTATVEGRLLLPTRLRIPVMSLDNVVEEVEVDMGKWQVSALNVGHHKGTGNPGEQGNVVLAAHRDINSALFRELDRLAPGDAVYVSNSLGEYRYIVKESFVVNPNQTEVMAPTDDKRVTLITCTPIGLATQRLIVVALLDESYPLRKTP